jgi:hypothetical protein
VEQEVLVKASVDPARETLLPVRKGASDRVSHGSAAMRASKPCGEQVGEICNVKHALDSPVLYYDLLYSA